VCARSVPAVVDVTNTQTHCAQAKAKNAQQAEEMQAIGKDRDELRAKFEAKSREKRLLEDHLQALSAENAHLKAGGHAMNHHDAQHDAALAQAAALHSSAATGALLRPQGAHFPAQRTMNTGPGAGGGIVTQTRSIHATQHFEFTTTAGGGGGGGGGGLIGAKRPAPATSGLGVPFHRLGSGKSPGNSGGGPLAGGVHRVSTSPVGYGPAVGGYNSYSHGQQGAPTHFMAPLAGQHHVRRPGAPSAAPSPRRGLQFGHQMTL
jgi:hypothetical protein